MKRQLATLALILAALPVLASVPQNTIDLDTQHPETQWAISVFAGATPLIRGNLYTDGIKWKPSSGWSGFLWYGTNADWNATSSVHVAGTYATNVAYADFQATGGTFPLTGVYYGGVVMTNASQMIEWGLGTITVRTSGGIVSTGALQLAGSLYADHVTSTSNPHATTAAQVGAEPAATNAGSSGMVLTKAGNGSNYWSLAGSGIGTITGVGVSGGLLTGGGTTGAVTIGLSTQAVRDATAAAYLSATGSTQFATSNQGARADTAYAWGNHGTGGYFKADGNVPMAGNLNLSGWELIGGYRMETHDLYGKEVNGEYGTISNFSFHGNGSGLTNLNAATTGQGARADSAYNWGNHGTNGYLNETVVGESSGVDWLEIVQESPPPGPRLAGGLRVVPEYGVPQWHYWNRIAWDGGAVPQCNYTSLRETMTPVLYPMTLRRIAGSNVVFEGSISAPVLYGGTLNINTANVTRLFGNGAGLTNLSGAAIAAAGGLTNAAAFATATQGGYADGWHSASGTVVAGSAAGATALQPAGNGSQLTGITASQVGADAAGAAAAVTNGGWTGTLASGAPVTNGIVRGPSTFTPLTNNQTGVTLSGTFSGNGSGLTNLPVSVPSGTLCITNSGTPGQVATLSGGSPTGVQTGYWAAASASVQLTPWTSTVNAATYSLTNATAVQCLTNQLTSAGGSILSLWWDGTNLWAQ